MSRHHLTVLLAAMILAGCGAPPQPATAPTTAAPGPDDRGHETTAPPPPVAAANDYHLVLEIESGTLTAPMTVADDADAGGGKCVRLPLTDKESEPTGKAAIEIDLAPAASTAQVWVRAKWGGTCANSVFLQVGQLPEQIIGEDGTYKHWHWVKGPQLKLAGGPQSVIISQREDDLLLDQVILTTDHAFVPVDIEE